MVKIMLCVLSVFLVGSIYSQETRQLIYLNIKGFQSCDFRVETKYIDSTFSKPSGYGYCFSPETRTIKVVIKGKKKIIRVKSLYIYVSCSFLKPRRVVISQSNAPEKGYF